jgi:peroxiredoxin
LVLLFVLRRFTYRTWVFHGLIATGVALAVIGWGFGGDPAVAALTLVLGTTWFLVAGRELRLAGSESLSLRAGDPFPPFTARTTDGRPVTERDLIARAPALLILYRGWWCPSSRAQHDDLLREYQRLSAAGLSVFAGSVDDPAESAPLQERVGDGITILCGIPVALLDAIGVRDRRGAPWYDRFLLGAARREIAMPAAVVVDAQGRVVVARRSRRIDDRIRMEDILAAFTGRPSRARPLSEPGGPAAG